MRITKKMIKAAEKRGACDEALRWLKARPRTLEQLARAHRGYWLEWALCYRDILVGKVRREARRLYRLTEAGGCWGL